MVIECRSPLPRAHSLSIFQLVSWNSLSLLLCQHTKNYTRPWTFHILASNPLLPPQHLKACSQWPNSYHRHNKFSNPAHRLEVCSPSGDFSPCKIPTDFLLGTPASFCRIKFFFKKSLKTFPAFLPTARRWSFIYFKPRSTLLLYSYRTFPRTVNGTHLSKHSRQYHS